MAVSTQWKKNLAFHKMMKQKKNDSETPLRPQKKGFFDNRRVTVEEPVSKVQAQVKKEKILENPIIQKSESNFNDTTNLEEQYLETPIFVLHTATNEKNEDLNIETTVIKKSSTPKKIKKTSKKSKLDPKYYHVDEKRSNRKSGWFQKLFAR